MPPYTEVVGRLLVGREVELTQLSAALHRAAHREAESVLVFGEAGVGKTALVKEALHRVDSDLLLLSGACLPLQSINVPLLPLRTALRAALPAGHPARMDKVSAPDEALGLLDAWLEEVTRSRPVALAIDDLQWADQSTLDLLMYLVAGPGDRPLALVATIRPHGLPDGHRLHRWLADVLRLPRVTRLDLTGLDRTGTEAQLAQLLGSAPHQSLVDDVFAHTHGNPYLNSLLARNLTPATRRLPENLPADLTTAVRQLWHQLSPPARILTSLAAVGGRPERPEVLEAVASVTGLGLGDVPSLLREALQLGMMEPAGENRYWFHHPLQPQVLEQGLTTGQRRRWHAAYAEYVESLPVDGSVSVETALGLAEHHDQAGHVREAYDWALRSWTLAEDAQGSPELRHVLRRAVELHGQLPSAAESADDLWQRLRTSAEAAGDDIEELRAVDALLGLLQPAEQPLLVSELLVRRTLLRMSTGAGFAELEDRRRAVEISAVDRASWQHALALAALAHSGMWAKDPEAPGQAEQALSLARASGNPRALCFALTAHVMAAVMAGRGEEVLRAAAEAVDAALVARDWWGFYHSVQWESNASFPRFSEDTADHQRRRREQLVAAGAPQTHVAQLSAVEAESWLLIGRWQLCQDRLRVTLGSDPGVFADLRARLTAALLAAWQGRPAEAWSHLARAEELIGNEGYDFILPFSVVRTVLHLEAGDAVQAHRIALAALMAHARPDMCEWLVPLASRALADRVRSARDQGESAAGALADLDALVEQFPEIMIEPADGPESELLQTQWAALAAWYAAEVARARHEAGAGAQWRSAAELAKSGQLPWVELYAWWRSAEAELERGRDGRRLGGEALARGYELARQLQATALLVQLEALSQMARVPLATTEVRSVSATTLPGLTTREREILDHLVSGATYAQIAEALVISEKTVSSHVSNLLRKTATSSRVELSRLVRRLERSDPLPLEEMGH